MSTSSVQDSSARHHNNGSRNRKVNFDDALRFVEEIKAQFPDSEQSTTYDEFVKILEEYVFETFNTIGLIHHVFYLFHGNYYFVLRFSDVLPKGYTIESRQDPETGSMIFGFTAPGRTFTAFKTDPDAASQPADDSNG